MSSIIAITGLGLTLGCATHEAPSTAEPSNTRTVNPPPPAAPPTIATPADATQPPQNISINPPAPTPPPEALPSWDDVPSPHPAGATNPPAPILAATADGEACFKEWRDIRGMALEGISPNGRILAEGETSPGTPIACPADRLQALLHPEEEAGDGGEK